MREYPYLSEAIANTLIKYRKSKKMSKTVLADFASIERCYLRDIEKGNRKPTLNTLFCLCEALQVNPVVFINDIMEEIEKNK